MFKFLSRAVAVAAFGLCASQVGATVVYANSVISANSTNRTLSNAVNDAKRLVPSAALGNESALTSFSTGYYSLGFGGSVTLGFSGLFGAGTATFYETTGPGPYPVESANIFVFDVASNAFQLAGSVDTASGGVDTLSFDGFCLSGCNALKIVDTSVRANFSAFSQADGYDVNAVSVTLFQAPGSQVPEPGSLALLGLGLAGLAAARKRKPA